MRAEDVKRVMSQGLAMVCATCDLFWRARARGIPGISCLVDGPCGGPIGGGDFAAYTGVLTEEAFRNWCFVCGSDSRYAVGIPGRERLIGVCAEHLRYLTDYEAQQARPDSMVMLKKSGTMLRIQEVLGPPPQTLGRLIADTEREWAKERGK